MSDKVDTPLIGLSPTGRKRPGTRRRIIWFVAAVILVLATPAIVYAINQMNRLPYIGSFRVTCGWHEACFPNRIAGKGLDFSMSNGTTIYSTAGGTVHHFGYHEQWGRQVIIRTPDPTGCYYHRYAHLYNDGYGVFVRDGQSIGKGSPIAYSDDSGQSSGAHLHYEVYHTSSCSSPLADLNSANSVYAATDTEPIYGYNRDGSLRATYYYNNFPPPYATSTANYENYSFPGSTRLTDDGDAQFSTTGSWTTQQVGFGPEHRNNQDMRWVYNVQSGANASASWRPSGSISGRYRLYAFIPWNYATTTRAHYRVTYYDPATGTFPTTDVYLNQDIYYNQWISLGTYCAQSDYPRVTLYNDTGETSGTKRVGADAVMWVRLSSTCPTPSALPSETAESGSANPVILPAEPGMAESADDTSWLTAKPPADMIWQSFVGKIETKDIALGYELLYPADWFIYPDGGAVQIQTFPPFETPDQAPPGVSEGFMKIDVGFHICAPLGDNCRLIGTPVVVAGLPGVAQAHKSELSGAEFRAVALQKGYVTLTIAAHIHGEAEQVKAYEQILGYMLSTLRVDE